MALLRSAARRKHYWAAGDLQYLGCWEPVPMKLVLWNRLKQRRPQRGPCDVADLQEFYRMEVAIVWWMFGLCFMMAPLNWWGKKYRMVHDHYPWMPKRHDGTPGVGPYLWFIE